MEPPSSRGPAPAGPAGRNARSELPAGRRLRPAPDREVRAEMAGEPAVLVADRRWHRLVPRTEAVVRRAASLGGGAGSVLLTGDGAVRRLNARHRGRNTPTNVLTFPPPPGQPGGDIVLALGTVRREAAAARRSVAQHLAHLVLHGCLHLRGHDHHGAGEARRMELAEARLLHRLGVPNPWRR